MKPRPEIADVYGAVLRARTERLKELERRLTLSNNALEKLMLIMETLKSPLIVKFIKDALRGEYPNEQAVQ